MTWIFRSCESTWRGARVKLKRLVSLGFLDKTESGLFAQPRPQTRAASTDQRLTNAGQTDEQLSAARGAARASHAAS
jgi:hypothetical protein